MKHEALWFRLALSGLAIVGVLVLVLSLHGRHRPTEDDARLPSVVGPAPQVQPR